VEAPYTDGWPAVRRGQGVQHSSGRGGAGDVAAAGVRAALGVRLREPACARSEPCGQSSDDRVPIWGRNVYVRESGRADLCGAGHTCLVRRGRHHLHR
jgi:hypothetical protein